MAARRGLNKGRGLDALFSTGAAKKKVQDDKKNKEQAAKDQGVDHTAKERQITAEEQEKRADDASTKTQKKLQKISNDDNLKVPVEKKKKASSNDETTKPAKEPRNASTIETQEPAEQILSADLPAHLSSTEAEKKAEAGTKEADEESVQMLRISQVVPNRDQPRKNFEPEALEELAASIKVHGILQPILVQKKGKYYEIIAGERRWKAARIAGIKKVPVLVKELDEAETLEISLIENIQRRNLNPIEEARAYQSLAEEYKLSQEEIAAKVSKSRTAITNTLRLLKLNENVQKLLIDGSLSMGHARTLLSLENVEVQEEIAQRIMKEHLSVRETEQLIRDIQKPAVSRPLKKEDPRIQEAYASMENRLKEATGSRVSIRRGKGNKGKIEIEYRSADDLERIVALFE